MWFKKKKRRKKNVKKDQESLRTLRHKFIQKTLKFTERVVVWVTLLYILNWVVSAILIVVAIKETMNFMFLDTLIVETSETFRQVVGLAIIKFGVENIFKYNDFGGHVPSRPVETNDEELFTNITNENSDESNNPNEGGTVG